MTRLLARNRAEQRYHRWFVGHLGELLVRNDRHMLGSRTHGAKYKLRLREASAGSCGHESKEAPPKRGPYRRSRRKRIHLLVKEATQRASMLGFFAFPHRQERRDIRGVFEPERACLPGRGSRCPPRAGPPCEGSNTALDPEPTQTTHLGPRRSTPTAPRTSRRTQGPQSSSSTKLGTRTCPDTTDVRHARTHCPLWDAYASSSGRI